MLPCTESILHVDLNFQGQARGGGSQLMLYVVVVPTANKSPKKSLKLVNSLLCNTRRVCVCARACVTETDRERDNLSNSNK